jgi:uncharacterized protein
MATPVIDAWAQVPNDLFLSQPWNATLLRWTRQADFGMPTVDDLLAVYDEAGVDAGLVCAWSAPSGPLITNDEVAALVARAPERLHGVAAVDLREPVAAVRELRRAVEDLGFVALRVVPWLWNMPPDDRRYHPL